MTAESIRWLIEQGIKDMGIDQWGWDLPLPYLVQQAKLHNDPDLCWQTHLAGFQVWGFLLKIVGASAAPARVVAMLDCPAG